MSREKAIFETLAICSLADIRIGMWDIMDPAPICYAWFVHAGFAGLQFVVGKAGGYGLPSDTSKGPKSGTRGSA